MMRTLRTTLTTAVLVALLAGAGRSQSLEAEDYASTTLFFNKGVQQALNLDANQAADAAKLAEQFNILMLEAFRSTYGKVSGQERREIIRGLMKPVNDDANRTIALILRPEQRFRFRQIVVQQRGVHAFIMPEIQLALKLTDAQKGRLKAIIEETNDKTREILQTVKGAGKEASLAKYTELRKQMTEKATDELTDEQKKSWKELVGAPFEYKFEPLS